MRNYFLFNNYNSLYDHNIIVIKGPPYQVNNEEYEEYEVEGRSGTLTVNKGTYKNTILPFELRILSKGDEDLFNKIDNIEEWLTNITDNRLVYDREDRCYLVKKVIFEGILNEIRAGGSFKLNFICEPFKYDLDEYPITLTKATNIYYNGTAPGECNIKIYGSGNIQLTINSETIQINNVNEYVELDSKLILCLNKDKTSKSRDMIGHFPLLSKGINNISWTGNISKIELLQRIAYR